MQNKNSLYVCESLYVLLTLVLRFKGLVLLSPYWWLHMAVPIFFSGYACGFWKFPGQRLNPYHSRNNAGSLTHCATMELPSCLLLIYLFLKISAFWSSLVAKQLRIQNCHGWSSGHCCGMGQSLAQEFLHAMGTMKKKNKKNNSAYIYLLPLTPKSIYGC